MQIKVSKRMALFLQQKTRGANFSVDYVELAPKAFSFLVDGDEWRNEADYIWSVGRFKVLRISYPSSYFAGCRYLTTRDLTRIFDESDGTADGFIRSFFEAVEV
jgi:hypothetical protein